ncbi:MAG: DUF192 domain-containing protein [Aquisalimonadaceae bacterium]
MKNRQLQYFRNNVPSAGLAAILLALLLAAMPAAADSDCRSITPEVSSMRTAEMIFTTETEEIRFTGRLAQSPAQRAAGMQHLCREAIHDNPMLFVFDTSRRPGFHMNNVHEALDILFLDEDGHVNEIHRMVPGGDLTFPAHPARYALELLDGESARLGLAPGMRLRVHPH